MKQGNKEGFAKTDKADYIAANKKGPSVETD